MNLELKGKITLIAGASHGIGLATARCLAQEGAHLILCSRKYDELLQARTELVKEYGITVAVYPVDATNRKSVTDMFAQIDFPQIDILVNAVGGAEKFGDFFDLKPEDWRDAYVLNTMSAQHFCYEAIPWLIRASEGRIINIASVSGRTPGLFNPHYSAAKAALISLTKHLATKLAPHNILVNAICPSTVLGDGFDRNAKDRADRDGISLKDARQKMLAEEEKKTPLGRIGTEEDVAHLVTFLASNKANYITGECINIDGGITRSI